MPGMSQESVTYQGVTWEFDDPTLPECGLCHDNRLLPYTLEDADTEQVVMQICQQCRDALLKLS